MDKSLESIVYNGSAFTREERSMGQEITDDIKGESAVYYFTCPLCFKEFQTTKKYRVSDNYVTDHVKSGIFFKISEVIWDTIGAIPLIGYYLRKRADTKVEQIEDTIENRKDNKVLEEAFQEVRSHFLKCTSCGNYACAVCVVDGVCAECRGEATGAGGEAAAELTAAYDQQLVDAEKMYHDLMEQNPGQKEMYTQQFEDRKKHILEAKKQALANMNSSDDD